MATVDHVEPFQATRPPPAVAAQVPVEGHDTSERACSPVRFEVDSVDHALPFQAEANGVGGWAVWVKAYPTAMQYDVLAHDTPDR